MAFAAHTARQATGGFNPTSDLPALQWILHPDDFTDIVSSEYNSGVDRKAGATFTAPTSTNRMPRNHNSERPGHDAAQTATNSADFLRNDTAALANVLNGNPAHTWFWYGRITGTSFQLEVKTSTLAIGTGPDRITLSINGGPTGIVQFSMGTAAGVFTNLTKQHGVDIALWNLYGICYDGAGTMELYVNGSSVGTVTGTHRATTNLLHTTYGAGLGYISVAGMCTGQLSAAKHLALYNWVVANA